MIKKEVVNIFIISILFFSNNTYAANNQNELNSDNKIIFLGIGIILIGLILFISYKLDKSKGLDENKVNSNYIIENNKKSIREEYHSENEDVEKKAEKSSNIALILMVILANIPFLVIIDIFLASIIIYNKVIFPNNPKIDRVFKILICYIIVYIIFSVLGLIVCSKMLKSCEGMPG